MAPHPTSATTGSGPSDPPGHLPQGPRADRPPHGDRRRGLLDHRRQGAAAHRRVRRAVVRGRGPRPPRDHRGRLDPDGDARLRHRLPRRVTPPRHRVGRAHLVDVPGGVRPQPRDVLLGRIRGQRDQLQTGPDVLGLEGRGPASKTVVARNHGYHGLYHRHHCRPPASCPCTGTSAPRPRGFAQIPAPYCFRCELGKTFPECGLALRRLAHRVHRGPRDPKTSSAPSSPSRSSAPASIIPPPPGRTSRRSARSATASASSSSPTRWCARLRAYRDDVRDGAQYGVRPERPRHPGQGGITSGYIPLGASVVSDEIWQTIAEKLPDRMPFSHGFTYSGHPVACAAALANLDIIENEGLVERAREIGGLPPRAAGRAPAVRLGGRRPGHRPHGRHRAGRRQGDEEAASPTRTSACERVEHEILGPRASTWPGHGHRGHRASPYTCSPSTRGIDRMVRDPGRASIEAMEADILVAERARPVRSAIAVGGPAEFFDKVLPERVDPASAVGSSSWPSASPSRARAAEPGCSRSTTAR